MALTFLFAQFIQPCSIIEWKTISHISASNIPPHHQLHYTIRKYVVHKLLLCSDFGHYLYMYSVFSNSLFSPTLHLVHIIECLPLCRDFFCNHSSNWFFKPSESAVHILISSLLFRAPSIFFYISMEDQFDKMISIISKT